MVMVKGFDKYRHPFNLHILVTILFFFSWLRFEHRDYKDTLNLINKVFTKEDIVLE